MGDEFVLDQAAALKRLQKAKDGLRSAAERLTAEYMGYLVNPPVLCRGWAFRLDTMELSTEHVPDEHWAACVRNMRLTETQVIWADESAGVSRPCYSQACA